MDRPRSRQFACSFGRTARSSELLSNGLPRGAQRPLIDVHCPERQVKGRVIPARASIARLLRLDQSIDDLSQECSVATARFENARLSQTLRPRSRIRLTISGLVKTEPTGSAASTPAHRSCQPDSKRSSTRP
jgi:hypothetical protein